MLETPCSLQDCHENVTDYWGMALKANRGPRGGSSIRLMQRPAPKTLGSVTLTSGFRVSVAPRYLPDHSDPAASRFVFAYRIRIANSGTKAAKLLRRRWLITDGNGELQTVEGEGVIGQQPVIEPGATHEYTSFCPLSTPWGTMEGAYIMQPEGGGADDLFEIEVGRFYFLTPDQEP